MASKKIPNQIKSKVSPLVQKLLKKCVNVNVPPNKEFQEFKEIYSIVQEIQKIEKDYVLPPPKRNENWEMFFQWCKEHNAIFDSVAVKESDKENYGVFAEKYLEKNELFMKVPRKIVMSVEHVKDLNLSHLLKSNVMLNSMENVALAFFLLNEYCNQNSFWAPYMSILPSEYDTILYFTLDDLEILQKSPVFSQTLTICRSVARQYGYFYQLFQNDAYAKTLNVAHYFTYDLYRWAVSTVMTRQNAIPSVLNKEKIIALIPLWDMCNHSNGSFSTDFNQQKDCLEAYSMENYSKNSEVNIFYGTRSNADFFVHNGFVYPDNENDTLTLKLGLSRNDTLYAMKNQLCLHYGLVLEGQFGIQRNNIENEELLLFLKINVLKGDEVNEALENDDILNDSTDKGKEIKQRSLKFLKDRAMLLIKCYKTTLQEDEKYLENCQSQRSKMAVELIMCEKRILQSIIDFCTSAMAN